jgi:signal transduction histidine kinase
MASAGGQRLVVHAWLIIGALGVGGLIMFISNVYMLGEPAVLASLGPFGTTIAWLRLAFSLLMMGAAVAYGLFLNRRVLRPLNRLKGTLAHVARGDYKVAPLAATGAVRELIEIGADLEAVAVHLRQTTTLFDNTAASNLDAFNAMLNALADAEALNTQLRANEKRLNELIEELQSSYEELTSQQEELLQVYEQERNQRARVDELTQLDQMKDQFLSILSHELRTPLNAIIGFGSVLDDGVAGELAPAQRHYVERILGSAEILLALINDLLDMSRIEAGKFSIDPHPTQLADVCEAVIHTVQPLADKKRIALACAPHDGLPRLVADEQRLRQVLTNLVTNAVKFTPEGGSVAVQTCVEAVDGDGAPTALRCEVTDTGRGIASADLPKLFKRFQQLDMSNTREQTGTGLGLSISKALVEAHGGTIGVESTPGQGSTFWFTLPMAPPEASAS